MPEWITFSSTCILRFKLVIENHRAEDVRWLAAIPALALRLIADRLEHGEVAPGPLGMTFAIP